ncbi:MAG: hypothetical protein ABEJ72_00600 [Candidatus Aenigmatarchaeota archaeon]
MKIYFKYLVKMDKSNALESIKSCQTAITLIIFLLIYGFLLRNLNFGELYAFGDFPAYYSKTAISKFLEEWHRSQLGYSYLYNTVPLFLGVATWLAGVFGQNLMFLILIPSGFLAFFQLSSVYIDQYWAKSFSALIYALNPVTVEEFVNGSVSQLFVFAIAPLAIYTLHRAIEEKNNSYFIYTSLLLAIGSVNPWTLFWMLSPFWIYFAYNSRDNFSILGKLTGMGVLGLILGMPNIHYLIQRALRLESISGNLFDYIEWNYSLATLSSVLRFAGNHGAEAMNKLGYNTEPVLMVGLVVPLVALFAWKDRDMWLFYGVVAAVTTFILATKYGLTYPLFELFPPLFSLRNPIKLQYPLLLSMSVLFGRGLQNIIGTELDTSDMVLIGVIMVCWAAYLAPASGAFGLEEVRGDRYYVSNRYYEVSEDLNGTVLWMPYDYQAQLKLRHVYPNHIGIKSGGIHDNIQNTRRVEGFFKRFVEGGIGVRSDLDALGADYIVIDMSKSGQYRYSSGNPRALRKWGAPWIFGNPNDLASLVNESIDYEKTFRENGFRVYKLESEVEKTQGDLSQNELENGDFGEGLAGWWTPPRNTRVLLRQDGSDNFVRVVYSGKGQNLPLAQDVNLTGSEYYSIDVRGEGNGTVYFHWFNGSKSASNRINIQSAEFRELPLRFKKRSKTLSLRIKAKNATISEVILQPEKEPWLNSEDYSVNDSIPAGSAVLRTSYAEGWESRVGGSEHFRAYGWANGFTNSSKADIYYKEQFGRTAVVWVYGLSWLIVIVSLLLSDRRGKLNRILSKLRIRLRNLYNRRIR